MQRRTFIQKSSLAATALVTIPHFSYKQGPLYSKEELMGRTDLELFGKGINLRKEAHDAFVAMQKGAQAEGFNIKMVSSYRSYARQKAIWERKYVKYTDQEGMEPLDAMAKIIEYSTIPGTSRHHWGTDIDIIDANAKVSGDVLVPSKFEEGGPFEGLKQWLDKCANDYGFYLVYTDNYFRKGFKYEPWHYSYAPISKPMLKQYRKLNLLKILSEADVLGAKHYTRAFLMDYIHHNILDINPELL